MKPFFAAATIYAAVAASNSAAAQQSKDAPYPKQGSRISLLVPLSPGGTTDTWARILADGLSRVTGARFQVVNDTSAGGLAPYYAVIEKPTDTTKVSNFNIPAALKYLYPNAQANFDRNSFSPVACTGYTPNVLVVNSDSPYKSLKDLVEAARARPGTLNAAADGALSDDSMAYANLKTAANADVNVVIVKGSAQKVAELLAKRIDFFSGAITGVLSQVKSGEFRVVAVLSNERSEFLKEAPTAVEQGVNVTSDGYLCLTMGAGAPEEARAGLELAIRKLVEDPGYQKANTDVGMQVKFLDGKAMGQMWAEQENMVRTVLPSLK